MTTTYVAATALEQLDQAQAEIDRHLTVRPSGRCATCGEEEPCRARMAASATFARFGRLPRRTPGLAAVPAATTGSKVDWFTR